MAQHGARAAIRLCCAVSFRTESLPTGLLLLLLPLVRPGWCALPPVRLLCLLRLLCMLPLQLLQQELRGIQVEERVACADGVEREGQNSASAPAVSIDHSVAV